MPMHRRTAVLCLTTWCLLASWLCFGGLELLEQVNLIPEVAAEDQEGQDLDEAALSQLASGLKPEVPSLDAALTPLSPGRAPNRLCGCPCTPSISSAG